MKFSVCLWRRRIEVIEGCSISGEACVRNIPKARNFAGVSADGVNETGIIITSVRFIES